MIKYTIHILTIIIVIITELLQQLEKKWKNSLICIQCKHGLSVYMCNYLRNVWTWLYLMFLWKVIFSHSDCEMLQKLDLTVNFVGELTSIECLKNLAHFRELLVDCGLKIIILNCNIWLEFSWCDKIS